MAWPRAVGACPTPGDASIEAPAVWDTSKATPELGCSATDTTPFPALSKRTWLLAEGGREAGRGLPTASPLSRCSQPPPPPPFGPSIQNSCRRGSPSDPAPPRGPMGHLAAHWHSRAQFPLMGIPSPALLELNPLTSRNVGVGRGDPGWWARQETWRGWPQGAPQQLSRQCSDQMDPVHPASPPPAPTPLAGSPRHAGSEPADRLPTAS